MPDDGIEHLRYMCNYGNENNNYGVKDDRGSLNVFFSIYEIVCVVSL